VTGPSAVQSVPGADRLGVVGAVALAKRGLEPAQVGRALEAAERGLDEAV